MLLTRLELADYRNYQLVEWETSPGLNVLCGPNAQGKTNLLEAIYLLATTRSYRAASDRELVRWYDGQVAPFSRVRGDVSRAGGPSQIEVIVAFAERGQARKRFRINGVPRRPGDVVGQVRAVLFSPEDLGLVAGPPEIRRRHLNSLISQVDRRYFQALARYTRVVTQRNALLKILREGEGDVDELEYWDRQLVADGALLMRTRAEAVVRLAPLIATRHESISASGEESILQYFPHVACDPLAPGEPEDSLARQLAAQRGRDLAAGLSLCGPHRDDLRFLVGDRDIQTHGSRGQQRTTVLAYKLAEADFLEHTSGERPLLLLDDVMSELDAVRRACLGQVIRDWPQVFLTTTELAVLDQRTLGTANLFRVYGGSLSKVTA